MKVFCKAFDSKVFGQIVVMRDFEEEKEKVKVMYAYGGAVQQIGLGFETEADADKTFDEMGLELDEKTLKPFVEFGMLDEQET